MQETPRQVVRLVVADDSAVMRGFIRKLFAMHSEDLACGLRAIEIVGEATDGLECLEMVRRLRPDLLLLDVEMPRMHGLTVLDKLRAERPTLPVIMCSAYTEAGARLTMEALSRGASDYVLKPSEERDVESALRTLLSELQPKIAALMGRQGNPLAQASGQISKSCGVKQTALADGGQTRTEVIVIGVSTGGPVALERLLARLPADLPVPVLIVQHMPKLFTGALAKRLDQCCALQVREAFDGAILEPGAVWLAPGAMHMEVVAVQGSTEGAGRYVEEKVGARGVQICLHQGDAMDYNRPSVDYLFRSAAKVYGAATMAAVLTGMGADGLAGSRSVHEAGGTVLAQDEATSVVWGMPGRVTQAGIAEATLPLDLLGEELTRRAWIGRTRKDDPMPNGGARYNAAIGRAEAANVL